MVDLYKTKRLGHVMAYTAESAVVSENKTVYDQASD